MAPVPQSKCYYVHTYKESGIQAHLYDLAGLVRDQGYVASYAERDGAKFKLGVCQGLPACGDALACLDVSDPRINIYDRGTPLPLATRMVSLGMEGGMLTAVYENETSAHCQDTRRVKVHFICPTDSKVCRDTFCVCACVCVVCVCVCVCVRICVCGLCVGGCVCVGCVCANMFVFNKSV